jgi:hypothetical protein
MTKCEKHGDVYLDCEGEHKMRRTDETLCSAHWAVYIYCLITGK